MSAQLLLYRGYRFPHGIISYAVWNALGRVDRLNTMRIPQGVVLPFLPAVSWHVTTLQEVDMPIVMISGASRGSGLECGICRKFAMKTY